MWLRVWVVVGLLAVFGLLYQSHASREAAAPAYRTQSVEHGTIASTVLASGKLRAVTTVEIGTQVSGLVTWLGADFNSVVEAGQIIAKIDAAPFEARLDQAEAEHSIAKAQVGMATASLKEMKAVEAGQQAILFQARSELERQQSLVAKGAGTAQAAQSAGARHAQAEAEVKAAAARIENQEAQLQLAHARVRERTASIEQHRVDLANTVIRSPIDGIVISRNVDVGQTVSASLEAPVLFTIAQDLADMQVYVSVDEADIGRIQLGQEINFTVDSYSDRAFTGYVAQIRKAGYEISNVVTYVVVASVRNEDLSLLPGMTATATIIIEKRADVLHIPLTAFYFTPVGELPGNGKYIWKIGGDGRAEPVEVEVGITDNVYIELLGGDLSEGDQVIVGATEIAPEEGLGGFRWPF